MFDLIIAPHETLPNVLCFIFNRPDKKNAINLAMYELMALKLNEANQDQNVHAVLFTGSSECFTSGNDIKDFVNGDMSSLKTVIDFLKALVAFEKPLIASVEGLAIGIGTTLLLHCDFVYATHQSRFAVPFVQLGLCPEAGSSILLSKRIGLTKANEMLLLGTSLNGVEASTSGLINGSFETNTDLHKHVNTMLSKIVKLPLQAFIRSKRLIRAAGNVDLNHLNQLIDKECVVFLECLQGNEAKNAMKAFLAKS